MRRTISFVLLAVLALFMIVSCQEPHTHTFAGEWKYDSDNHWHAATCEHTEEVIDKAEHTFDDGTVKTAPGYGTTGLTTYTCKICGYTKDVTTEALVKKDNTVSYTGTLSKDYDGTALSIDETGITRNGDGVISFMYKKASEDDSAYTSAAPKDAGKYSVKISVAQTTEWKAAETVVTYTINTAELKNISLKMVYEVLPDAEETTGIGSYKSKTFTVTDGLPEGVTVTVYPYNEDEDGTFTVGSSGEGTYVLAGTNSKEEMLLALQSSNTIPKDVLVAYVDSGSNYSLPEEDPIGTLTVTPKRLSVSGTLTATKAYDGKEEITITDLSTLSGADGISLSDYDYVITMKSADAGADVDGGYLKHKTTEDADYNFCIDKEDIDATITQKEVYIPYYILTPMYVTDTSDIGYRYVELGNRNGTAGDEILRVKINPTTESFAPDSILPIVTDDLSFENSNYTLTLSKARTTSDTSRVKSYKNYEDSSYTEITDEFSQVFTPSGTTTSTTTSVVKEACYKFTASEGEEYRIKSKDNELYIGLWDESGNSYYLDNTVADKVANFTVPATGTYYIICLASTEAFIWIKNNRTEDIATATFTFSRITTE